MRKLFFLLAVSWALPALSQFNISQLPPANLPIQPTDALIVNQTIGGAKTTRQAPVSAVTSLVPPLTASYLLQSANPAIPNSRTLVGTANEILLADGGPLGNLVLSTPQPIATTSSPTFSSLILTNPLTVPNGGLGVNTITGLVVGNGVSAVTPYVGTSCTNQFVRALSSTGVATCNTVANTDLANSSITLNGAAIVLGGTRTLSLASADFVNQGTTTTLLHGNAAGNPSFGQVSLTADVSGILPGANGGTGNGFFSVAGPATALKTFTFPNASATVLTSNAAVTVPQGGTGVATLTAHGVLLGEGAGNVSAVAAMAADTLLQGQGAAADPAAVSVNNCGSTSQALSYSTTTHAFGCQTLGVGTVTSLTGGTGITASPSTITTTGSFAIDQTFSPTWTGTHTFSIAPNLQAGFSGSGTVNGSIPGALVNTNTGTAAQTVYSMGNNLGTDFTLTLLGGNYTGAAPCGNCLATGDTVTIRAGGSSGAMSLATVNTERMRIANNGAVTVNAPTSAATALQVIGVSGSGLYTENVTAGATAGQSFGMLIAAGTNSSDFAFNVSNRALTQGFLAVRGDGEVEMNGLVQSSAVQTGTLCWGSARGQVTIDTTVACLASTIRVKQAIVPLDAGLAQVLKMRPVSYDLKPEFNPMHLGRQVGLIAEEVQKIDPRLVALDDEGLPRGVRYMQLTAVLIKAVQQQQLEIYALWILLVGSFGFTYFRTRRRG